MTTAIFRALPTLFESNQVSQRMNSEESNIDRLERKRNELSDATNAIIKVELTEEESQFNLQKDVENRSMPLAISLRTQIDNILSLPTANGTQRTSDAHDEPKCCLPEGEFSSYSWSSHEKTRISHSSNGSLSSSRLSEQDEKSLSVPCDPNMRKGKWTPEEEAYTSRIIHDFHHGYLPLQPGTTLRTYLSDKLNCDPMRITKKFAGAASIGKRVFAPCERTPENMSMVMASKCDLAILEERFRHRTCANKPQRPKFPNSSNTSSASTILITDPKTKLPSAVSSENSFVSSKVANEPLGIRRSNKLVSFSSKNYGPSSQEFGISGFCPPHVVYAAENSNENDQNGMDINGLKSRSGNFGYLYPCAKSSSPRKCPPAKCRIDEGYDPKEISKRVSRKGKSEDGISDSDAGSLLLYFSKSVQKQGNDTDMSGSEDSSKDDETMSPEPGPDTLLENECERSLNICDIDSAGNNSAASDRALKRQKKEYLSPQCNNAIDIEKEAFLK